MRAFLGFILVVLVLFLIVLAATGEYNSSPEEFYQKYLAPDTTQAVEEVTFQDSTASTPEAVALDFDPAGKTTEELFSAAESYYDNKDYEKAMPLFLLAAGRGHASSQYYVGLMYDDGQGVQQDYAKAMEWYQKSATQGDSYALNNIGWMYRKGLGVEQNDGEAVVWYTKAADLGNKVAQNNLGYMYENGFGVETNLDEAVRLYRLSADQGFKRAKENLERLNR